MATEEDSRENIPASGAVFTFGRSRFADNEPNRFWIRDDPVKQVACGDEHTVLLTASGRVFTFGSNDYGQLGHGITKPLNKPTCVKGLKGHQVSNIACGRSHTLILLTSGEVLTFGQNNEGQLGVGDESIRQIPTEVLKLDKVKILAIAGGAEHSVALTAKGLLYVWGSNSDGQLGMDDINQTNVPHSMDFHEPIKQAACGYYHTAIISEKGLMYTFGEADYGKLGYAANRNVFAPKLVSGVRGKVKKICCGGRHTVVLTETGLVYAMGDGSQGQLGLGPSALEAHQPEIVEKLSKMKIKDLECGENHNAVITESKQLYVWGDGQHGKLGIGHNGANAFLPMLVDRLTKFDVWGVGCGGCHTLVLGKPSNSWEDREHARRKLTSKAVSFHGKHDSDDDDSDKNSDHDRRKSVADFSINSAARNKRRLNSLHDPSPSQILNRTLPPLGQRNGVLPAYSERNFKNDPFARPIRATKSDDSDSDASQRHPTKSTSLYTNNGKPDPLARYPIDKRKSTDSDSDASPRRTNNTKTISQSLYKPQRKVSDSSDDDRSTKSEPSKNQNSLQKSFNNNNNGRKDQLHKSGSFSTQFNFMKGSQNNKSRMTKSNSDSDTDDKHRPHPMPTKRNDKVRKSSDSSNDERNKNKRNDSASTQSSYGNNSRNEDKKPKFLDKFRGSKSKKANGPLGRRDSDTDTTTSKEAVKSKTCVLL